MGLFGDTLHDARRPLAGDWLRRSPDQAAMTAPDQDIPAEDMPDNGMQTVFRFQKAESPASMPGGLREASSRSGAGISRIPAGDPLTVGAEAGSPEPFTKHVEETHISVQGDNRESELATGQVKHTSPGKIAAANAKSVSSKHQSEVTPGRIEAEPYRETHQSEIPEGSERSVSRQGETFLSRPPGRGASPSETHMAGRTEFPARAPADTERQPESGRPKREAVPVSTREGGDALPAPGTEAPGQRRTAPDLPNLAGTPRPTFDGYAPPLPRERGRAPEPAPPGLVIGRIDVVVVADAPAQAAPAARTERGYLSRNYLKRL
ncbi:MAG: hypothetical protein PHX10_10280 [Gallionellaceae bacterium]|nr:hypothetical protein [Gallionellaceae bacterium]